MATPAADRPAVSAVLLSFDCERYVAAAVESALGQDYDGPLEIVVSDDASSDRSFALACDLLGRYRGPHRVTARRREVNSGSKSAHLNDVLPACAGEIIVSFDGDDVSAPSRVSRIVARMLENPHAQAVYSSYLLVDATGSVRRRSRVPRPPPGSDAAEWFARVDAYAAGATLAVRRSVVQTFGPLDPGLNEDLQLPFRASLSGAVEFIDEPLVRVHRHAGSFTADWQRYASLEKYRERALAGIANADRARRRRLADIATAAQRAPAERPRWERLAGQVERSFREAEMTRALLDDSVAARLQGLVALCRAGAYLDALPQHAFLALAPRLYLRYRRLRLGLGANSPGRLRNGTGS
jgi:glycosyltransferase involved in cell wall biosynthesis